MSEEKKAQNEKTRLLFVIPGLGFGGAERQLINLLTEISPEIYEIHLVVFYSGGGFSHLIPDHCTVHLIHKTSKWSLPVLVLKLAYSILPGIKPHFIISFMEYTNLIILTASHLTKFKCPLILTEHSVLSISLKHSRLSALRKRMVQLLYPQADAIVGVSNSICSDLIRNFGIPADKMRVIHNGIDLQHIQNLKTNTEVSRQQLNNEITIASAGRLVWQKNFPFLLRSFAAFNEKHASKLLIAGEGPDQKSLEILAIQLGIADRVIFLPFSIDYLINFSRSSVFVLPSKLEGMGNVLLEVMAFNIPVIATSDSGGPSEIVSHGKTGILVKSDDVPGLTAAIDSLVSNSELREKLIKNAADYATNFDKKVNATNYCAMLEAITLGKSLLSR